MYMSCLLACLLACYRDDVGDHAKWHQYFNAPRILHDTEVTADTQDVEVKLTGEGPWALDGEGVKQHAAAGDDDDVIMIFTPGHTSGHVSLLYKPDNALFTGRCHGLSSIACFPAVKTV